MFVYLNDFFFFRQENIPQKGHSADYSKTTFGSTLASFVTEIFIELCPFGGTPLPLQVNNGEMCLVSPGGEAATIGVPAVVEGGEPGVLTHLARRDCWASVFRKGELNMQSCAVKMCVRMI